MREGELWSDLYKKKVEIENALLANSMQRKFLKFRLREQERRLQQQQTREQKQQRLSQQTNSPKPLRPILKKEDNHLTKENKDPTATIPKAVTWDLPT